MLFGLFIPFIILIGSLMYFDAKQRILPNSLNLSLLWLGLLLNPWLQFSYLYAAVLGAVMGYLILFCIYWVYRLVLKKEGLGLGDAKMLAALGAWFGWQSLPLLVLLASGGTLCVLTVLKLAGRYPKNPQIPMGIGLGSAGIALYIFKLLTII